MTLMNAASALEKETAAAPYDPMAPHYEAFVGDEHVMRYGDWLGGLIALAVARGARVGRAFDVGCGTGRSIAALQTAGFTAPPDGQRRR